MVHHFSYNPSNKNKNKIKNPNKTNTIENPRKIYLRKSDARRNASTKNFHVG